MQQASGLSPVAEDEVSVAPKSTQERVDWENVTDVKQLRVGRRLAKAAHTNARKAIAECSQRRGNAAEYSDLVEKIQREFDQVVKRHERYLRFADLESDELEEEDEWLVRVEKDHDKALNAIQLRFEGSYEPVQSRSGTPAIPLQQTRAEVHTNTTTTSDVDDADSHALEFEQSFVRPMSTLSVRSLPGLRNAVTPPPSNDMPTYSAPANSFQRVVRQVGSFTSRAIGFFTPKRDVISMTRGPTNVYPQQPYGYSATALRAPRPSAQPATGHLLRPVEVDVRASQLPPPSAIP